MYRSKGGMSSPKCQLVVLAAVLVSFTYAGPLGPLTNVTSSDVGLKEGTCAVGDVVYLPGDEFPGSSACERCSCTERGVHCRHQQCEPRPGCKALHRPDQCCPTYQCECEQEGRVYGNGEKLVDPADPCRVCYCQGGEVVCRRIACFIRDDCTPRLVPGRCCPEYDNCPLRGVTALPGMTTSSPISTTTILESSAVQPAKKETQKQEITIKEITPVSEIPIITEVKIKEILPSPSIEVAEYSSSKSPLIPREATSERPTKLEPEIIKDEPEGPSVVEVHSFAETSSSPDVIKSTTTKQATDDARPSKISLSTQDSINSDIYPSNVPIIVTMGSTSSSSKAPIISTSKAPMIEEEDPSLFDHNPAFPPLPDDLSVLSNHGDEIVPESSADADHMPTDHTTVQDVIVASITPSTEANVKEILLTTYKYTDTPSATEELAAVTFDSSTSKPDTTTANSPTPVTNLPKEVPVINLRSAIPTELLNSSPDQEVDQNESPTTAAPLTTTSAEPLRVDTTTENIKIVTEETSSASTHQEFYASTKPASVITTTTNKPTERSSTEYSYVTQQDQTTNSIAKSNVPTEVTSQTELSSLPIETSDQNPHDASEKSLKESIELSTTDPIITVERISSPSAEVITVSKTAENGANDNMETTEFVLTPFGSSESATDAVELIKIAGDSTDTHASHAPIIDNTDQNKYALRDFIKLVSDVASMSDKQTTESTGSPHAVTAGISDSEELIPVNAGYKSKANYNQNSITEVPTKSKNASPANKQKVVEIEEEESSITDSPPPNDKIEPTTRRPIIDNVSDDNMPDKKSEKKDIEIITQSYVPTINKRPTKVVLKDDKSLEMAMEDAPAPSASLEITTEGSSEAVTGSSAETATDLPRDDLNATLSAEQ